MDKKQFKQMYSELRDIRRKIASTGPCPYAARNAPSYMDTLDAFEIGWEWRWEGKAPSRLIRYMRTLKNKPAPKFRGEREPGYYYKHAFKKKHHFYPNQYAALQQAREKIQSLGW